MEFVEAEQPRFLRELRCGESDRIVTGVLADFHLLAKAVDALMNVEHEFMEVRAALALHRTCREEQIHQHGLAAADLAVDVETLDRRQRAFASGKQPAERRRLRAS